VGNRYIATASVALLGTALLTTGQFQELWPIFGSANTLLAALALLAVTAWLHKSGRSVRITLVPMIFMFLVTLTSLALLTINKVQSGDWALGTIAALLFGLSIVLIVFAKKSLSKAPL
jgi:carbon starvation protein